MADPSLEWASGVDDDYGLAFDRRNRVGYASMTGGLVASRETENTATRLNAGLVGLLLRGDLHQGEWQDNLALSHSVKGPVDNVLLDAKTSRDETLQAPATSADLLIGRGLRRSLSVDASWDHELTPRLSTSTSLAVTRQRYSGSLAGAHDYQNATESASLRYRLDERDSVNANVVHQDYRTLDDGVREFTDSLTVGATRAMSETSNASVSLGAYRSRSKVLQPVVACPGNATSCDSGEVIVVEQVGHVARWGVQYNASYGGQLTERTRLDASAVRQQDPSGAGVTVLGDTLRASLDHSYSETLQGTLAFTRSSARYLGSASQSSRLQTLSAQASRQLSPRLSLRVNADWRRSALVFDGLRAHDVAVSVTLRYEWQRLEAHH